MGAGIWYTLQPKANGRLTVDLFDSDYDTGMVVFTGDCDNLVEVQCNDDEDFDAGWYTSYLQFDVVAGTRYYIVCGGFEGAVGDLDVALRFEICDPGCENDTDFDGLVDSLDSDKDGDIMPNDWEIARGLDPDRPADGLLDGDFDGYNNTEEFIAGTIHTNGMSYLRFSLQRGVGGPGQMPVRFDSVSGRVYHIDYRPNLDSGSWLNGPSGIIGDGTEKTIMLNTTDPRLNIRVGVDLAP